MRHILSFASLAFAAAVPAPAADGPLELTSKVLTENRQRAADGTTRIALEPVRRAVPGDKVVFVLSYRNTGRQPLDNIVFNNPVPKGIAYRAAAEGSAAPEVSVDGQTFGTLAALRVKTASGSRAAGPDDVTHVRWRLARPLTAGAQGQFAYRAVLK